MDNRLVSCGRGRGSEIRFWEHVNEPSGSIKHALFLEALSPFALRNVFNPFEHEAERDCSRAGGGGLSTVHRPGRYDSSMQFLSSHMSRGRQIVIIWGVQ